MIKNPKSYTWKELNHKWGDSREWTYVDDENNKKCWMFRLRSNTNTKHHSNSITKSIINS